LIAYKGKLSGGQVAWRKSHLRRNCIKGLQIPGVRQDQQRHNAVKLRGEASHQLVEDPSKEPDDPDAQSPERLSSPEQGADPMIEQELLLR